MSESVRSVSVDVPAKVNLLLRVGPRRPDGFHGLVTVFHAVGLVDRVTASDSDELSLSLHGPESRGLPAGPGNIAWRAAELLAAAHHRRPAVELSIEKRIPVAAGLAGGSADAAGALLACASLWELEGAELHSIATGLGSDVPFALRGGTALGTGRGEVLADVEVGASLHWVIAASSRQLSTPAVYAEFDRLHPQAATPDRSSATSVLDALRSGDLDRIARGLGNDLQEPALALAPELAATLRAGTEAGALAALVSGSGPTCVFLASGPEHAQTISDVVAASGTCRLAIPVQGGAPGAAAQTPHASR